MKHSVLLTVDATINVVLGLLLIGFPRTLAATLGVPGSESGFYPSILGGVLIGIGVALIIQVRRRGRADGLGIYGAVAINLCAAVVLVAWLLWGELALPVRGRIFLWSLVAVLVGVSLLELISRRRAQRVDRDR